MNKLLMGVAALALVACGNQQTAAKPGQTAPGRTATSAATAAVKSESKTFRDWHAVCDNGNLCSADAGGQTGWILIQMDAGGQAQPTVRVGMWPDSGDDLKSAVTLAIDGSRHVAAHSSDDEANGLLSASDARAAISQLAAGRSISLSADGQTVQLPTAGVAASLLWFDERQGRLDTTTALIRKGTKPSSAVPAAPALPVITPAPAVSQAGFAVSRETIDGEDVTHPILPASVEALPLVKQCREDTAMNEYVNKAVTANRLNASTELWGVPCGSGAYNESYAYYLTGPQGANPKLIYFPDADGKPRPSAEGDDMWLTNPSYDADTRTMTAFAKGRGIGDCGVDQSWIWTGEAFVLSRERVMSDCFGITSDLWPFTFRSR